MIPRLLLLLGAGLLLGAAERPQPKLLDPVEGARLGRALVADILSQKPAQSLTNTGILTIGKRPGIPVRFQIVAEADSARWTSAYETTGTNASSKLTVVHNGSQPNGYCLAENGAPTNLAGNQAMIPFAGSDFWLADLGLEFFHWPEQRLLKNEMRRSRSCRVLESINPQPAPGAYSRVVSWIDSESQGIVRAEAYDFQNRLLKTFEPKEFKKVEGQWQLEEMEINNRQTGSRTRIEFQLGAK